MPTKSKNMINGAHVILYSRKPEADRAFLRDVLRLNHVDVGEGWLIFGLPPSEIAVHPSGKNNLHELYLMCDDIGAFVERMKKQNIICGPVKDQGYGLFSELRLPGGGRMGVYEPRHARPQAMKTIYSKKKTRKRSDGGSKKEKKSGSYRLPEGRRPNN